MLPLTPAPTIEFRPDKLQAAVHYVCFRSPDPRSLGKTKLNKILYYADREAYLRTGRPITHSTASVTVLADSAMIADAWATALLALGQERGLPIAEQQGLAVLFIARDAQAGDNAFKVTATARFGELQASE